MNVHLRPRRVVFKVSGAEAHKLLNDVITGHVEEGEGGGRWWALLTPQGKIVAEGLIGWHEGAFWLDVDRDGAERFYKMMRLYRMRASAEIERLDDTHSVGWAAGSDEAAGIVCTDPRGGGLGVRVIADNEVAQSWSGDAAFDRARIAAGIVEVGTDYAASTLFPHDIAMDLNDGIDAVKGCYIGQEVVSRMKHRGTARRRPVIVNGLSEGKGTAIDVEGRKLGETGLAVDGVAVAILRIDRAPADGTASADGRAVSLALPDWASYRFADSEQG